MCLDGIGISTAGSRSSQQLPRLHNFRRMPVPPRSSELSEIQWRQMSVGGVERSRLPVLLLPVTLLAVTLAGFSQFECWQQLHGSQQQPDQQG